MTRDEFEACFARERGHTVAELAAMGYRSAPDCDDESCGWQAIAIPHDATQDEIDCALAGLVRSSVRPFGSES